MAYNITNGSGVGDNGVVINEQLKTTAVKKRSGTIDAKTAASTLVYTTDSDRRLYLRAVRATITNASGGLTVASISIGTNSPLYDNILPIAPLTGLLTTNKMLNLTLLAAIDSVAPSTGIYVKVTTPATGTTLDFVVDLIGDYE